MLANYSNLTYAIIKVCMKLYYWFLLNIKLYQ